MATIILINAAGTDPELKYRGAVVTAGGSTLGADRRGADRHRLRRGLEALAYRRVHGMEYRQQRQFHLANHHQRGSGKSIALELLETTFHQDLNGDGTIGLVATVIESSGSTSLVQVGNNYYLESISSGTGPELKYGGAAGYGRRVQRLDADRRGTDRQRL